MISRGFHLSCLTNLNGTVKGARTRIYPNSRTEKVSRVTRQLRARILPHTSSPSESRAHFIELLSLLLEKGVLIHRNVAHVLYCLRKKHFDWHTFSRSSVQFNMVVMRSEKPICAPPRLSAVSPTLPLKQFLCCMTDDGPLSSFQGRRSRASSLLPVIDGVMSLALRPHKACL